MPHRMGFSFRILKEWSTQTKHVHRPDSACRPQLLNLEYFPNVLTTKQPTMHWVLFMPWHVPSATLMWQQGQGQKSTRLDGERALMEVEGQR